MNQAYSESNKRKKNRFKFAKNFKFPHSWKEVKGLGWKFILAFILFYLIRDTILYIIVPYLIYSGACTN